jgi:predicted outer membrane repeat protein
MPSYTNLTFSGNSAASSGSAIYNDDTSNPTIKNSIFWDNGNEIFNQDSAAQIANSLVRGGCPAQSGCTQVISSNPLLGPLANNGGFTQTIALGAGSPAIDTGNTVACPDTDQRGKARIQGPGCDMGAYEKQQSSIKLLSQAANDGWIVESGQGSGKGGSLNTSLPYILVGDDVKNAQIRAIVSFDTGSLSLPSGAILSGATLKVKLQDVIGGNPFSSFGSLLVDARKGPFNANAALELVDFTAVANPNIINSIPQTPVDGFYTTTWLKNIAPSLAGAGPTQMRLRFTKGTNKNLTANALKFYSGNAAGAANRPQLIIYYYLP